MNFSDYPADIKIFYIIGLHVTVWVTVYALAFAIERTVTLLVRRRRARTAAKEATR